MWSVTIFVVLALSNKIPRPFDPLNFQGNQLRTWDNAESGFFITGFTDSFAHTLAYLS